MIGTPFSNVNKQSMVPDDTKTHADLKTCQTIYVTENQVFAMIDYLIVYKKYNLDGIN